jgi:hypothetical protein
MARQRFSAEQIIHPLRKADVEVAKGTAVDRVYRILSNPPVNGSGSN